MSAVTEDELYAAILADVQTPPERNYYTPKEITAMLRCSTSTTYTLIHRNTWLWLRVSDNVIRVGRKSFDRWLRENQMEGRYDEC